MGEMNRLNMSLLNHALDSRANAIKALYQELKVGILDLANVEEQVEMNKKQMLEIHKKMYNYWQGKNGKWYSYLPKEGVAPPKGKQIESVTEEKLNNKIFDYYIGEEKAKAFPTFNEVYHRWREVHDLELVDNSILKYDSDFIRYFDCSDFGYLRINEITENTIKVFILETVQSLKLGREATGRLFSYIKNTIRHGRIERIITDNPMEFLELKNFTKHSVEREKPVEKQFYSNEELALIQKGVQDLYAHKPLYMPQYAIELAMLTGMRSGEIAPLKWEDISEDCISINKSEKHNRRNNTFSIGKTKTGKSREFPMCDEIAELLERVKGIQEANGILCEYIFTDGENGHIHGQQIGDCMRRVTNSIGLHGGSITALRKTINSNLRSSGVPVTIVASMLGHTTDVNEQYYTYDTSNLEEKKAIVRKRNEKIKALIA